jgi:ubiquinone/menaquinone biosynthesis C-methylase UbiE
VQIFDQSAEEYAQGIGRLQNYNTTYQSLADLLRPGDSILELACGPANISRYLRQCLPVQITGTDLSIKMLELAQKAVPEGRFLKASMTNFLFVCPNLPAFDAVINGFGLPFLTEEEAVRSFALTERALKPKGSFYLSFMQGEGVRTERPSFSPESELTIRYHDKVRILELLQDQGFTLLQDWSLDYREPDGRLTIDQVLILQKTLRY